MDLKLFVKVLLIQLTSLPCLWAQSRIDISYLNASPASFRAIKNHGKSFYIAGSKGYVAKLTNKDIEWKQLKGYENSDFRSIAVLGNNELLISTAGSPALILYTKDFFNTIDTVYVDRNKDAFLDAMYFTDKKIGFVLGDPQNGKMQLLKTKDGGKNWNDITDSAFLKVAEGEAAFAASNTNITGYKNHVWIATGGSKSHVFHSKNLGKTWQKYDTPIWQGKNSTGIFSILFLNENDGIAVGGDYTQPDKIQNNAIYTHNGGKTWKVAKKQVNGYRSGLVQFNKDVVFAVGINGIDISYDAGKSWKKNSNEGFNAGVKVRVNEYPDIYFIGDKGKLGHGIYY